MSAIVFLFLLILVVMVAAYCLQRAVAGAPGDDEFKRWLNVLIWLGAAVLILAFGLPRLGVAI